MANGFLRATKDSDLLVPDGRDTDEAIVRFLERIEATRLHDGKTLDLDDVLDAHHVRVRSRHGIIDIMRGGLPPLDYETVNKYAMDAEVGGSLPAWRVFAASLASSASRADLRTSAIWKSSKSLHGELPIEPIPGLDA